MLRLETQRFETPVGPWTLTTCTPSPDVACAVESYWEVESATREFRESVVPRGTAELIINLGEPHWIVDPAGLRPAKTYRHAWISGLQRECLHIHSRHAPRLIAARIRPAFAATLVDLKAEETAAAVVEWDPREMRVLRQCLGEARTPARRFALLEDFIRLRLAAVRPPDAAMVWASSRIAAGAGTTRHQTLYDDTGLSRKQFIARFRRQVGFAPKLFSRILRFDHVISTVRRRRQFSWTDVALECGYYDQAHFNSDFRAFLGCTPGEFLAERDASGQSMRLEGA